MQCGFEFMIIRLACWGEAQQAGASKHTGHGIHNEQVARLAVDIANAKVGTGPQLPIEFKIAYETAGTRVRLGADS